MRKLQWERGAHLCVGCGGQALVKGSSSELMLLPRPGQVAGVGGCGGVADVLLGSDEGGRLHGGWCGAWACRVVVVVVNRGGGRVVCGAMVSCNRHVNMSIT